MIKRIFVSLFIFGILLSSFPLQLLSFPEAKAAEEEINNKEKEVEIVTDRIIVKLKPGISLENQPDSKVKTRREGFSILKTSSTLDKTLNKIGASNARRSISSLREEPSSISILGLKIPTGSKISSDFGRYYTLNFDPKLVGISPNLNTTDKNIETFRVTDKSQNFQKYQMLIRMIKANPDVEDVQLSYRYKKIEDIATVSASPTPTEIPAPTPTPTPSPSLGTFISVLTPNGGNTLNMGETYKITWNSSDVERVSIGYSPFFSCLDCIAKNIPNTGYYDWKVDVGATLNTKFKILLIGYKADDSLTIDQSDDYFTILPSSSPTPSISPTPSASSSAQLNDSGGPTPTPSPSSSPVASSSAYPNDPYFSSSNSWGQGYDDEWNIKKIKADQVWPLLASSSATIAAVIDTGVDYNHEDLQDVIWTDGNGKHGFDFVNNDDNPIDDDGHGTHIAGTIGASINNSKGVVGVSSKVQIMAIKGLDQFGSGFDDQLASAIIWASDHGAKVINMSWGGYGDSAILIQALNYASSHNVTLVAAAGNDDSDVKYFFPANHKNVIAVGASDENDQRTTFSNKGVKIDLIAPGGGNASECQSLMCYNILSTKSSVSNFISSLDVSTQGAGYMRLAGTSMAAPHVVGAAAAVISKNSSLSPSQIRAVLLNSTDDVGIQGRDDDSGYGRLNVLRAVSEMNITPVAHGEILIPQNLQIIRKQKNIIGTVEQLPNSNFTIEYSKLSLGPWQASGITLTNNGTGNIVSGVLGNWNTSGLTDGRYYLKLTIKQSSPLPDITSLQQVIVNNKLAQGWPANLSGQGFQFGPMVSGDLTADGRDETLTQFGSELFAINADGQTLGEWPLNLSDYSDSGSFKPAMGELVNSNPGKEIVVASTGSNLGDSNVLPKGLYMLDSQGQALPNWPKSQVNGNALNIHPYFQYAPVIADIDGDGNKDIIYPAFSNSSTDILTVFKSDGTQLSGFPVNLPGFLINTNSPILVTKVNNQIRLSLFIYDTTLNATALVQYSNTGTLISSKNLGSVFPENILLADMSGDSSPEIIWTQTIYPASNTSQTFKINYHVFDLSGNEISNWPKTIDTGIKDIYTCDSTFCNTLSYFVSLSTLPADLNNDGKIDLVTTGVNLNRNNGNQSFNENTVLLALGNDGSQIISSPPLDSKSVIRYSKQIIADTNGDNKQEVVYLGHDKDEGQYYLSSIQMDNQSTKIVSDVELGTIGQNCANLFFDTIGPSLASLDYSGKQSIITPVCKFVTTDYMQQKIDLQNIKTTGLATKHAWLQYLHDSEHSSQYGLIQDQLGSNLVGSWKDMTSYNGVNQATIIPDSPALSPSKVTVSAWVNIKGYTNNYGRIIAKHGSYELIVYGFKDGEGMLEWDVRIPQETDTVSGTTAATVKDRLKLNTWYHVAASYDGNTSKIYVNGVKVAEKTNIPGSLIDSSKPFAIAGEAISNTQSQWNLNGDVKEVKVYYGALSDSEIQSLYNTHD